jgi:hypothetical protein
MGGKTMKLQQFWLKVLVSGITLLILPASGIAGPNKSVIAAGDLYTLAIQKDGSLWTWGSNGYGRLGLGDTITERDSPTRVGTASDWVAVAASGWDHALALKANGSLWAWGDNGAGQLGLGDTTDRHIPTLVSIPKTMVAVAAGWNHSLALAADGSLWAWGDNAYAQLGLGDTTDRLSPTLVGSGWVAVAAGGIHSLALKADGSLWVWGSNGYGQLGLGDTITERDSPTRVGTASDWVAVAAGDLHSLALKADGSLWVWGSNGHGQLGLGDTTDRHSPTLVGSGWVAIAAGWNYSLGFGSYGSFWAWGENNHGQLGLGDTTDRHSPTQVGTTSDWVAVAAGSTHSLALAADGSLWVWGWNQKGELGLGDTIDRYTPTRAVGFNARRAVVIPLN